jgi:hypothetical protein
MYPAARKRTQDQSSLQTLPYKINRADCGRNYDSHPHEDPYQLQIFQVHPFTKEMYNEVYYSDDNPAGAIAACFTVLFALIM